MANWWWAQFQPWDPRTACSVDWMFALTCWSKSIALRRAKRAETVTNFQKRSKGTPFRTLVRASLHWDCTEALLKFCWDSIGILPRFERHSTESRTTFYWGYIDILQRFYLDPIGILLRFHRHPSQIRTESNDILLRLYWHSTGILLRSYWDSVEILLAFYSDSNDNLLRFCWHSTEILLRFERHSIEVLLPPCRDSI